MKANTRFGNRHTHKGRMPDGRGNNGAKQFVVIRDPQGVFSEGAVLGILDIQYGLHDGVFSDGMAFNTSDGRLRVDRGGLVYARNRAKYHVRMPRI